MNTYTHFLWAIVLSRWILLSQKQKGSDEGSDEGPDEEKKKRPCCPKIPKPPGFDLWGALFGSVLPDLFLISTTVVCFVHDSSRGGSWTSDLFNVWYFENPWIIAGHNLFHSPLSVLLQLSAVYMWHAFWHRPKKRPFPEEQQLDTEAAAAVSSVTATAPDALPLAAPTEANLRSSSSSSRARACCRFCACCQCCVCCLGWGTSGFWYWALVSAMFHALCDIPVHHDDGPLLFWPIQRTYRYEAPFSYWDPNYYGVPISIAEHTLDAIIVVWLIYLFCKSYRPWRWCQKRGRRACRHGTASMPDEEEMQIMMVENTATDGYADEGAAAVGIEVLEHGSATTTTTTIRKNRIASTTSEPNGKALD